ncbi:MAG: hypothetical protein ACRDAX_01915 [Propionibacteriaceae bacterium]
MKRMVWFGVGVAATTVVLVKANKLRKKASPSGVQQRLATATDKVQDLLADFLDTFKAAATERETELRETLGFVTETS